MKRLGIGATFQQAFGALWLRRKTIGIVVLAWFALDLTYYSARSYFTYFGLPTLLSWLPEGVHISDYLFAIGLASNALRSLIGSGFAVLLLRLFLVGLPAGRGFISVGFGRAMAFILAFNVLMTVAYGTAGRIAYHLVPAVPSLTWTVSVFSIWMVAVWIGGRLSLVYVNVALGGGWQVWRSWRTTAGSSLPLFMIFASVLAGAAMIGRTLDSFLPIARDVVASAMPLGLAVLAIPDSMVHVATHILLLTLIAVGFARLTGYPAVGVPGAAPTVEQLVGRFE